MSVPIVIGSTVGAALGVFHAAGVFAKRIRETAGSESGRPVVVRIRAGYAAAWTVLIWTVFGTYVLALWLVSVPLCTACRLAKFRAPIFGEA